MKPILESDITDRKIDRSEIEARILKHVRYYDKVNMRQFSFTKTFEENGLDSLDRTGLITCIEDEFKTLFTDNMFENFNNLQQIVDVIHKDNRAL